MGRPNLILFVEDLTGLVSESLPDFWRLGQAYFSSALFQVCMCVGGGGEGGKVCVCVRLHEHVSTSQIVTQPFSTDDLVLSS